MSHHGDEILVAPDRCTRYRASSGAAPVRSRERGPRPIPDRLLGIWAHPDDEAYLSAGVMAQAVAQGGAVTLLALTDGEAGFPADDARPAEERSRQRRRELRAAMAQIGVDDVRFLGLPDGGVAEHVDGPVVDAVSATIRDVRPDLTVTFGPEGITGHEDHVATWRLVTRAWAETRIGDLWYAAPPQPWLDEWREVHDEAGVWMTTEPEGIEVEDAVLALELAGPALDRKRAVLREHGSQTEAIASMLGEDDYRRWIRWETFRLPTAVELAGTMETPACPATQRAS